MKKNMSAVNDPVYIMLVEAREQLIKEHERTIADLDERINRRIMQLAVEELS